MRVATWNVNSLKVRLPRVLELLEQHQPDLLLMQETKCSPGAFPALELEAAGYHVVHHSAGQWAGVAIAAPLDTPIGDVCAGLAGEPAADEARWIEAASPPTTRRCSPSCPASRPGRARRRRTRATASRSEDGVRSDPVVALRRQAPWSATAGG